MELLEWRTGIRFSSVDKVLFHHEVMYLSGYNVKTAKYCADPWSVH